MTASIMVNDMTSEDKLKNAKKKVATLEEKIQKLEEEKEELENFIEEQEPKKGTVHGDPMVELE